jgi:4-hydroxythreonine-4-phosphate dehydrogenase
VEELGIDLVRSGPEAVRAAVAGRVESGGRLILACDAETDDDLASLAEGAAPFAGDILFAGSAGFAAALVETLPASRDWLKDDYHPPVPDAPSVFFGGSASSRLREQLEILASGLGAEVVTVRPASLFDGPGPAIPPSSPRLPLILTAPPPSADPASAARHPGREVAARFGRLAADLVRNRRYGTVFVSGGETARATLAGLGHTDILLRAELLPGVVHMSAGALSVLSKSGDFGEPDILLRLYEELREEAPPGLV